MRHGPAENAVEGIADAERSLTPEGHAAMKHIGYGLERVFPRVRAIYSSPLLRATQSARWLSKAYRLRAEVKVVEALGMSGSRGGFGDFVESITERRAVIVGHAPNLREAVFVLTGVDPGAEPQPGGCYGIRLLQGRPGLLEWILPPAILQKLGE